MRRRRGNNKWIQKAIKRPGALTKKLKGELGKKIKRTTGMNPFTRTGEVNTRALQKFRKTKAYERLSTRTKQQINFAITAEGFRKDRRRR